MTLLGTERPAVRNGATGDGTPRRTPAAHRTSWRRRWADRVGRGVVRVGGFLIIASVLGILLFIVHETLPLLGGARVDAGPARGVGLPDGAAVLTDEYRGTIAALAPDGRLHVVEVASGRHEVRDPLREAVGSPAAFPFAHVAVAASAPVFVAATADGRLVLARVRWEARGEGAARVMLPDLGRPAVFAADPSGRPVAVVAGRLDEAGAAGAVARLQGGSLVFLRRAVETNAITGETTGSDTRHEIDAPASAPVTALALDAAGRHAWAGTAAGEVIHWNVEDGAPGPAAVVRADGGSAVTALGLLIGDRTLVSGHADGALRAWLLVRGPADEHGDDAAATPREVRHFAPRGAAIRQVVGSSRDKGFLALDAAGALGLYHSTAHRRLWSGPAPVPRAGAVAFAPKADGAAIAGGGQVATLRIDNPHPDVSLEALFAKVWYEGYERPEHVWQSSSGTDDFEPKYSLTPLLFGTLKGTFYSLVLAIPLGVLGAMYTSQFMHHRLRQVVKPVVEIMASLPSVVLGFLAGLWLAPRLETYFPALLLAVFVLPAMSIAAFGAYGLLPARLRARLPSGSEAIAAIAFLAAGLFLCLALEPPFERALFGGPFQGWLNAALGMTYDQRNAVVVGLAMGFAVIPIIFSVSEEAFSNVPRGLVAGSLALGASRWQTVTRVVLPSASPGIFSAIMIGFGRAVGETMIVLMATGNTPIMDASPFNGFRTLSANIAVEIPEAARGSTLYRTLFLAGLLLFALTFAVNTVAELVRQNLRRRYANL